MTRRPSHWEYEERRNARIRQLREQREGPVRRRRRVEPLLLAAWIAGTIALLGVALVFGFNVFFAPRVMAWVEQNPGAIEHGIVQDFVQWYQPEVLDDAPASDEQRRVTVDVVTGSTDTTIGRLLFEHGLIRSEIAFQYAVITAGREGTLAAGVYDLFPTMRPSQIVATLQGQPFGDVTSVTLVEGLRLEEVVAAFAASSMTMNMEEFANLLQAPPADLLNQFDFLADLPAGRSLEGYILPETLEFEIGSDAREVVVRLLEQFGTALTQEIRDAIAAKGLTLDQAVIVASIVEREAVIDDERALIAAVYTKRFLEPDNEQTAGLLNADPTLQYGLTTGQIRPDGHPLLAGTEGATLPVDEWGSVDWWPQLQVGGGDVALEEYLLGFQTYTQAGLPPMPIAAPRIESIAALASAPLDEGYLYFVAGCPGGTRDGSHYFSRTNGEHEALVAQAREECAGQ
ncbi:MAG: endolytic transglycosylase MltG [Chloroflexi bacterium]|nr:endolytic transglycosylase MltG [Chloroflexota bacterium]MBA3740186.1 endolytic transglycosylase MltG [Chloroflexota bacterium]